MKKTICAVLCLSVIGSLFAGTDAKAASTNDALFGRIAEKVVYVHRAAEEKERVTQKLYYNDEMLILANFKNKAGENWLRVRSDDHTGWIQEDQIRPYGAEGLHLNAVKDTGARRGADSSEKQTGTVQKGKGADVYMSFINKKGERWVKANNIVLYRETIGSSAFDGWIKLEDLTIMTSSEEKLGLSSRTAAKTTVIYKDSGLKTKTGYVLPYKAPLNIKGVYKSGNDASGVFKVSFNIKSRTYEGWIPRDYADTYAYQGLYGKTFRTIILDTAVHRSATHDSRVVAHYKPGTNLVVTDTFYDPFDEDGFGKWRNVLLPNGQKGWVNDTAFFGV
ncbi:hypothetical protein CEF21_08155 [Bacillus sp. FJAT-42376]|uniref:hypothetical protein n=1 Tax=Bacillus sp. FJAT-42376 TaxID=2014076 RepID=UPI000F4E86BC|nr:hypothetical protein [Bacillus sp. FJAT-42376]AZB42261.1 hypothetical protein CEF21_08155 [Bacillus sp. FJAT-42376]